MIPNFFLFLAYFRYAPQRNIASLSALSETHKILRETCRSFADNELKPIAAKIDKEHLYPQEQIKQMGDLGLMGIATPESNGLLKILWLPHRFGLIIFHF